MLITSSRPERRITNAVFLVDIATFHLYQNDYNLNDPQKGNSRSNFTRNVRSPSREYSGVWRLLKDLIRRIVELDSMFCCTFIQSVNACEGGLFRRGGRQHLHDIRKPWYSSTNDHFLLFIGIHYFLQNLPPAHPRHVSARRSACSSLTAQFSIPNGPGARQGPEDGLPRAQDRTGRQNICCPRPQNIKTAVLSEDDKTAI